VGTTTQVIDLTSQHTNPGHLRIVTDFVLRVAASEITVYVCATSQEEAEQIFDEMYNPQPLATDPKVFVALPVGGTQRPDANGNIQVQAHVFDDLDEDPGYYTVTATVEYLDLPTPLPDTFPLFNDGPAGGHGDGQAGDAFYNALWQPQAAGEVLLTLELHWPGAQPGAPPITDSVSFTVEALPDLAVTRVFQEVFLREDEQGEMLAEIASVGLAFEGPVYVGFSYYRADDMTGEPIEPPLLRAQCTFNAESEDLRLGDPVTVIDRSLVPEEYGLYFAWVEVGLDPFPWGGGAVEPCETRGW
jgi:hypothetical protein